MTRTITGARLPVWDFDVSPKVDADLLFQNGFTTLRNFISADDVASVRLVLEPLMDEAKNAGVKMQELDAGRSEGGGVSELERVIKITPQLTETVFFQKALTWSKAALGQNAQYLFDHLIDKSSQTQQPTAWHQDCAYARLTKSANRIHWWLPLQAVDEANGCLLFVKGSHRGKILAHQKRRVGGPLEANPPPVDAITRAPLSLGDVSLHLPKALHSAGPNNTDQRRLAWVVHFGINSWTSR